MPKSRINSRKDLEKLFEERTRSLSALNEVAQTVNRSLKIKQVLNDSLDKVLEVLKVDASLIRFLEPDSQELVITAHKGFSSQEIQKALPRRNFGEGSAWDCARLKKPIIRTKMPRDAFAFRKKAGFKVSVKVPLMSKGSLLGIMSMYHRSLRDFNTDEIELLSSIGNLIGVAIDNANMFSKLQQQTDALNALNAVSQTVNNRSLEFDQVLQDALSIVIDVLKVDAGIIRLWDEDTQGLVFRTQQGLTPEQIEVFSPLRRLGEGPAGKCIQTRKAIIFENSNPPGSLRSQIGLEASALIPLTSKDRLVGLMSVYQKTPRHFLPEEIELFTSIGHQVGVAIENARLYQDKEVTIKELNETQDKLQQIHTMEAIGTLAGGIAHDFNNLMMAILGNASLMLLETDPAHPHYRRLKNIEMQVKSGSKLTEQLLGYARKGKYFVKPINLNKLLEDSLSTVSRTRKEIVIHFEFGENLFSVEADQGQLEQVLLNLYVNAADAMPDGGDLYVKTMNVTHREMTGKPYHPTPGSYVLLKFIDTGTGIDKKAQKRIFDPFFTTKEMGRGTGLGLASVYGIIKGHSGYIDVQSEINRGTTFNLYLPASDKKVEKKKEIDKKIRKGSGTILFVDDEQMVLTVAVEMFTNLGYAVLQAKSGNEAVQIYRENKDKIDLVVLDMVMPGMSGSEVFDRIKGIDRNVKVLLSSGYSIDGQAKKILDRGCDGFIQKPFDLGSLSEKVSTILDKKFI